MSLMVIPPIISSILCTGLALFAFSRNTRHLINRSFTVGMLALALMEFGNFMALNSSESASILFWKRFALVGECLAPGSWLLFSLTFSRSNYQEILAKWKWLLVLVYLSTLAFLPFIGSNEFIRIPPSGFSVNLIFLGRIGYYFYVFFLLISLGVAASLEKTLRASTTLVRWKIKYILLGIGAIFVFFIYSSSQYLLFSALKLDILPITSIVIIISTFMIAFSLTRHRLLDVDIFISRQIVYHSLIVSVVGIYLLTIGLIGQLVKYFGGQAEPFLTILFTFMAVLALTIFLLSEEVRRKVKLYISQNFYKNKYDYREKWMEFTEGLGSKIAVDSLLPAIIELLAKTIWVDHISMWLYDENKGEFYLAKSMNLEDAYLRINGSGNLIHYLKEKRAPVSIWEIKNDPKLQGLYEENSAFFKTMKVNVCVPLIAGERMVGLLTLGEERSSGIYTHAEYELLKAIASQVSSSILIAQLSQDLVAVKQMETFHRLSTFVIHDIKNFIYMLSLVVQNASGKLMSNAEFQQDVLKMMSDLVTKMQNLITKLSTTPDKLHLEFKEEDLNQLVENTLSKFLLKSYKKVVVCKDLGLIPKVKLNYEQTQNVLMNLILNAAGAIEEKGEVRVNTYSENGWVVVSISDNGQGMSQEFMENSLFKPFQTTKKNGLGIGLYQCKTIIEAHRGKIEVESQEGKGSTFKVHLPKD
jgi:hypothetical protein